MNNAPCDNILPRLINSGIKFPLLLALLLVGIPLFLNPFDFWDGRILYHGFDIGENRGAENWFMTSGWFIQYYIYTAVQSIDGITAPTGTFVIRLIIMASVLGLVYESMRFGRDTLKLPPCWALVMGISVAVFPAWNALVASSVIFIYVLCSWLVLWAVRLIYQPNAYHIAAGFLILLVSFQLNSNFVFCIAMAVAHLGTSYFYQRSLSRTDWLKFIFLVATPILAYVALKASFTPSGLYEGYNSLQPIHSIDTLLAKIKNLLLFFQYPILLGFLLTASYIALECLSKIGIGKAASATSRDSAEKPNRAQLLWPIALSLFLIGSAAFPYVVVGRDADLRGLWVEWNPRHTFLMAMPVGLFLASLARILFQRFGHRSSLCYLPAAFTLIFLALLLISTSWSKLSRAAYEQGMITALKEQTPPKAGFVTFVAPEISGIFFRFYETNWLLYQAYGTEAWYSGVTPNQKKPIIEPKWIHEPSDPFYETYKIKHIMRDYQRDCDTVLKVEGKHYGVMQVIGWAVFGQNLPNQIRITRISENCSAS